MISARVSRRLTQLLFTFTAAAPFTGEMGSSGSHLLDPNPTTKVAGSAPAAALHRADSDPVHAGDEEAMLHELRSGKKALASEKFESTVV